MTFAKIFDSSKYGQILAKRDTNDEGAPELRIFFEPPQLGVCSVALNFPDTDAGYDLAQEALERMDAGRAESLVSKALPADMRDMVWSNAN